MPTGKRMGRPTPPITLIRNNMNLILASKSPRRREILSSLGVNFNVITLDTEEVADPSDPSQYVEDIARCKGDAVRQKLLSEDALCKNTVILSCDTVVVSPDGEIMGKPRDREDAKRMLLSYSGKRHAVISGVALLTRDSVVTAHEMTYVYFDKVSEADAERYIDREKPYDKAGAYAIQEGASLWIDKIEGDYFNVVGLPVKRVEDLLRANFGISILDFE